MRYLLTIAALVALLGPATCLSPYFAQAGTAEKSATVLAQLGQGYTVGRTRSDASRDRSPPLTPVSAPFTARTSPRVRRIARRD